MSLLTEAYPFSFLIDYTIVFIFCLFGAYIKDSYNTFVGAEEKVKIVRIFISAAVASAVIFGFSDSIVTRIGWKGMYLVCFVGGMLGFESMSKIQKLDFWVDMIEHRKDIVNFVRQLNNQNNNSSSDSDDNDKNENNEEDGE